MSLQHLPNEIIGNIVRVGGYNISEARSIRQVGKAFAYNVEVIKRAFPVIPLTVFPTQIAHFGYYWQEDNQAFLTRVITSICLEIRKFHFNRLLLSLLFFYSLIVKD